MGFTCSIVCMSEIAIQMSFVYGKHLTFCRIFVNHACNSDTKPNLCPWFCPLNPVPFLDCMCCFSLFFITSIQVPTKIKAVEYEDLPFTSTGKIRRAELKRFYSTEGRLGEKSRHPADCQTISSRACSFATEQTIWGSPSDGQHNKPERVCDCVNTTLQQMLESEFMGMHAPLQISSANAVRLAEELSESLGVSLPALLAYNHPSGNDMVECILGIQATGQESDWAGKLSPNKHNTLERMQSNSFCIVVTAVSVCAPPHTTHDCQHPCSEAFSPNFGHGEWLDCTTGQPCDRGGLSLEQLYHPVPGSGGVYVRHAAFVTSPCNFDTTAFCIPPNAAMFMDPQHRQVLLNAHNALSIAQSHQRRVSFELGVFAGCMWTDEWISVLDSCMQLSSAHAEISNGMAFLAGRCSFQFGLTGTCVAVNTACSSSLVALHLGFASIQSKESLGGALAAGVSLAMTTHTLQRICTLQALSMDGRSKTFDATADGYGRGTLSVWDPLWVHDEGLRILLVK